MARARAPIMSAEDRRNMETYSAIALRSRSRRSRNWGKQALRKLLSRYVNLGDCPLDETEIEKMSRGVYKEVLRRRRERKNEVSTSR